MRDDYRIMPQNLQQNCIKLNKNNMNQIYSLINNPNLSVRDKTILLKQLNHEFATQIHDRH